MASQRLNKYIALCSEYSRRMADKLIEEGVVTINGNKATMGMQVEDGDVVEVYGKPLKMPEKKVVLAFNKPVGVTVSKKDDHADILIDELIDYPINLTYAGRLDKDSEGLILLSNDGDLINKLMRGSEHHEKEYIVKLNKEATEKDVEILRKGIYLSELKVKTRSAIVEPLGKVTYRMVITQGLNRQIRRMWSERGYKVTSLKRVRIENIKLGSLKSGEYREITDAELTKLYKTAGL